MTLTRWAKRIERMRLHGLNEPLFNFYNTTNTPPTLSDEKLKFITSLLQSLKNIHRVKAVSLISVDGMPVASLGTETVPERLLVPATIALLATCERVGQTVEQGNLEVALVKSAGGTMLVAGAGKNAALVILFDAAMDLPNLFTREFPLIDMIRNVIKSNY